MQRASRGTWGYAIDLDNLQPDPVHLQITISGGSAAGGGCTVLVPETAISTLGSHSGFLALVNAVAAAWPVQYAFTTTRAWDEAVNPWPSSRDMLPIGGLTFSHRSAIGPALPESVAHERFGPGTVIAITERPDLLRADDVKQALFAREALVAKDLLKLR